MESTIWINEAHPADAREHRDLDGAFLEVPDVIGGIALCEDDCSLSIPRNCLCGGCRSEIRLHIEWAPILRFAGSFGFHDRATIISRRTDPAVVLGLTRLSNI